MRVISLVLFIVAFPVLADDVYRDAGAGAYSFLKIDPGAEAAALGGTGLLNSGELALFTNPALLNSSQGPSLSVGHNQWLGDASQDFLCWNFGINGVKLALGTRFLRVSDLQMREEATSQPITTFSSWDISMHAGAGIRLGMFDLGIALKLMREKIWTESSSGFAVDAGVVMHPLSSLELAAALQHMGPAVTMVDDDYRLPVTWRVGGKYTTDVPLGSASVTAELGKPLDNRIRGGCGLDYAPMEWVHLRFGFRFGDDTRDVTSGLGLSAGSWTLDYAFVPTDFDLGSVHRFTLNKSL